MKIRRALLSHVLIFCLVMPMTQASVNFGAKDSAIEIVGNAATLNVLGSSMSISEGTVKKEPVSVIKGNKLVFSEGVFINDVAEIGLTADGDFDNILEISMNGNDAVFRSEPGLVAQRIIVRGSRNRLEGQPTFQNSNAIVLHDQTSTLSIAIQSALNQNVILNQGTLGLANTLKLGDDVTFTGSGTIVLNGNQLILGGKSLTWTDTLLWKDAGDIMLNSDIRIKGQWIFQGNSNFNGHGNTLDLSHGGTIWIRKNTILDLNAVKIKGFGSGFFVFENNTSQLRMSLCEIEMDRDVTMTRGGIYVSGASRLIVKDKILRLDSASSLTVDGCPLSYEPLEFADKTNIQPKPIDDPNNVHIKFLNNGTIVRPRVDILGVVTFDSSVTLTLARYLLISPDNRLNVNSSLCLNGNTHVAYFTRIDPAIEGEIVIIDPNQILEFKNIVLRDLASTDVSFGNSASKMLFGDRVTMEIFTSDLNYTWTFKGDSILDGVSRTLTLGPNGRIFVTNGAQLTIRDITIKGLAHNKIRCDTSASKIVFDGRVNLFLDNDFTFSTGSFDINGDLDLSGTFTFHYTSNLVSSLKRKSSMKLRPGTTFRYAPSIASKDLFDMQDPSAELFLNGATLATTSTGIRLRKGTLTVDRKSFLQNPGGVSDSQAIVFGDGVAINDLQIKIVPAASLQLLSGKLVYNNVN